MYVGLTEEVRRARFRTGTAGRKLGVERQRAGETEKEGRQTTKDDGLQ